MSIVNICNIEKLLKSNNTFESHSDIDIRMIKDDIKLNKLYLLNGINKDSELQLECNGLIIEKDTNNIICMSQNKFTNLNMDEDELKCKISESDDFKMEYCEDGTVIRLYNYQDEWFTATTKCIDARKSFWSSTKTFNDMFFELFNYNTDQLNKSYTYSFILIHKDNRNVVNHQTNKLIYINSVNNITKEEDDTNYFEQCIKSPIKINTDTLKYPLDKYYLSDKRGVLLKFFNKNTNSWKLYQYDFNKFNTIKDIRGNVPHIRMRYIELLNYPEKLELLEMYYPENMLVFAMVKHCISNLYKNIHKLYIKSHIKHLITIDENHKYYKTLKQLHGFYKKTGTIITIEEVIKKINSLDTYIIKNLIGWIN